MFRFFRIKEAGKNAVDTGYNVHNLAQEVNVPRFHENGTGWW